MTTFHLYNVEVDVDAPTDLTDAEGEELTRQLSYLALRMIAEFTAEVAKIDSRLQVDGGSDLMR